MLAEEVVFNKIEATLNYHPKIYERAFSGNASKWRLPVLYE